MTEITRTEYMSVIENLADYILEEVQEHNPGATEDELREALEKYLWQTVDGHEWVIYTYKAQQIIALSDNDGYSAENFGAESILNEEGGIKWEAIAFGALYADVSEILWSLDWEPVEATEEATR